MGRARHIQVAVYKAVVLTNVLYGCETWTMYRRSIQRLDQFHLRCLRKIAGIKWRDRVTNTKVLQICDTTGIVLAQRSTSLGRSRYAYARVPYPKTSFLWTTVPARRYKDTLRVNLKQCNIDPGSLTSATSDRSSWRTLYRKAVTEFEDTRVAALVHKRAVRKFNAQPSSSLGVWPCDSCSRVCSSRTGLFVHQKTHR